MERTPALSEPAPPSTGDCHFLRRPPPPALAGDVVDICDYRETRQAHFRQRQPASLVVPLIVGFGDPFVIGLGRTAETHERYGTFAAGLFAGPVYIDSFGASACVQVNFTPRGARRFFGMPLSELTARMIPLDTLLGADAERLRERLALERAPVRRLDIVARFVAGRLAAAPPPCAAVGRAMAMVKFSRGRLPVGRIAAEIGWSRKHLNERFKAEIGLGPKAVARIVRLDATMHAIDEAPVRWAEIADQGGYSDQAHFIRECRALTGISPAALQHVGALG